MAIMTFNCSERNDDSRDHSQEEYTGGGGEGMKKRTLVDMKSFFHWSYSEQVRNRRTKEQSETFRNRM